MQKNQTDLQQELKVLIIDALSLEDINPDEILDEAPLFGEGLGLDSIDALELGISIQKKYGVRFETDSEQNQTHFASVVALAKFISENRQS